MKDMRKLTETVSFLDQWHFLDDVYPENKESVWFVANGKMYVGTYSEVQGAIILADGEGIGLNDVVDWKAIGSKQIAVYPKEKDILAAEIPGFPALVMGIFTDHIIDEETGDEVSGIILDDIYAGLPEVIQWDKVFSWYLLPTSPEERVIIKNITIETPDLPIEKEEADAEEYDNLDGQVDFDGPKEGFEEPEKVAEPEVEEAEKPEDLEAEEKYSSKIKDYAENGEEEIKEAKKKKPCFGTVLTKHLEEINALPTKKDVAEFVQKVCEPYADDPEQKAYLDGMIRNIYAKRNTMAAIEYVYNIILAGNGLRVLECKLTKKGEKLLEGRPKGSKNKKTLKADDDDEEASQKSEDSYDETNDELDLEPRWEENPKYKSHWTHAFDEFKFGDNKFSGLSPKARDFAWWWHHELFYSKSDPDFNKKYRSTFIDKVDGIFSDPNAYKGKIEYDDSHDVGMLYDNLVPKKQEEMDALVREWCELGGLRNKRKLAKRAYSYE